jgi:hypothetical protein
MVKIMNFGLLWNDSKPLAQAVPLAAARYAERFGVTPDTCYVNPAALPDGAIVVGEVRVLPSPRVLEKHFWIGVEVGECRSAC